MSSSRKIAGSCLRSPSARKVTGSGVRTPSSRNTQSYSRFHISENIKSLKEGSGSSFKGKIVVTSCMKTKKERSNQVNGLGRPKRRQLTAVKKSLDWDTAFFTNQGLLNTKEISMILTKASTFNQESSGTRKDTPSNVPSKSAGSRRPISMRISVNWDIAFTGEGLLNPGELFMVNAGFNKPKSSQSSTKSQISSSGSASFTTVHSNKSSSSTSHGFVSRHPQHPPCRKSSERNVMPSRLKLPSPRIGFFDEKPPHQPSYRLGTSILYLDPKTK